MKLGFLTDGNPADVHFAATEGFDCLELALFGDTPLFEDHSAFKSALTETGIPLAAVSIFGQNYFDPTEGESRMTRLKKVADLTAALESPIFVFGTGSTLPGNTEQEWVSAGVEKFRPIISHAQGNGLTVAFYNCHWENFIDRPSAWEIALPQLPGVGIKFDPSHPIQMGRDWKAELLAAGPNLKHAHAKDVLNVGGKFIADPNPGLGDIRWESFFGILNHIAYDGAVCIEPHSAIYTGEKRHDFLRLSHKYLRQFMI
jgi:sugar phosphate isomerase/epimerase